MGCSGPVGSATPSMVRTLAPSSCQTNTVQDFTALPLICTTQAPHWDVSHPTWVPVSRRFSRRYCTRSVRGSTSAVTGLPFTVSVTADMGYPPETRSNGWLFAPTDSSDGRSGQIALILRGWGRVSQPAGRASTERAPRASASSCCSNGGCKFYEEVVRRFLRGAVDQALPQLGKLAADLCLDVVGKQRAAILVRERNFGTAFGKTGNPALPFARDAVAVGRIEVR